jgi:O-antigen ligase
MAGRLTHAAEALLLGAVVVAPWAYGGAPDTARYALAALLLFACALWETGRALAGRGLPALALAAAGLPLLALFQAVSGTSAARVWTLEALLLLVAMMGVMVFWSERARDRAALVRVAGAVLLSCTAQAIFGAVQWSRAPDRVYGQSSPIVTTPFGSYVNHNHFAGLVGTGVVLSAAMALGHARRDGGLSPAAVGLGGLSLALTAAHLASRSRGGLLALAAGLAVMALLWVGSSRSGRMSPGRLAMVGGLALVVLAFGLLVIPRTSRSHLATLAQGSADSSGAYRMDVAAGTLRLAVAHPIVGSGLGAYPDAFPPFKRGYGDVRTTHAENDVLEFLAEGGLAGVLLAGWLGWSLWRGFENRLKHGRDPFRKSIVVGALAAVAALAVHSVLDFNLRLPANALVFATLLGVAASPREERPAILVGRLAPAAAALTLAALAATAAWRAWGAHELKQALAQPAGDRRVAALDHVVRRHPYLAEAWRVRGLAWRERGWGRAGAGAALAWAEADLSRALELRPRWGEAWADLAWTHFGRGNIRAAREAFDRAVALDPTHLALDRSRADFLVRTNPAEPF